MPGPSSSEYGDVQGMASHTVLVTNAGRNALGHTYNTMFYLCRSKALGAKEKIHESLGAGVTWVTSDPYSAPTLHPASGGPDSTAE